MSLSNYLSEDILKYIFSLYIDYINIQHILKRIDSCLNFSRLSHIKIEESYDRKTRKLYIRDTLVDDTPIESLHYNDNGKLTIYYFFSFLDGKNIRFSIKGFYEDKKIQYLSEGYIGCEVYNHYYHDGNRFVESYQYKKAKRRYSYDNFGNLLQESIWNSEGTVKVEYFFVPLLGIKHRVLYKNKILFNKESYDSENRITEITTNDEKTNTFVNYKYKEDYNGYVCDIHIERKHTTANTDEYKFTKCNECDSHEEYKEHSSLSVTSYIGGIIQEDRKVYIIPIVITCWIDYEKIINNLDKYCKIK